MIICIRLANERECKASHKHAIFTRVRINIFIRCLNDVKKMRSWIECVLLKHIVAYAGCALVRCDVVKKMTNIKNAMWLTCNESTKSPGYIVLWLRLNNLSSWFTMIIHFMHHDNSNINFKIFKLPHLNWYYIKMTGNIASYAPRQFQLCN